MYKVDLMYCTNSVEDKEDKYQVCHFDLTRKWLKKLLKYYLKGFTLTLTIKLSVLTE